MTASFDNAKQILSTVTEGGELHVSLEPLTVAEPKDEEIVVAVEASPINPSDLGLLLGPADMETLRRDDKDGHPRLVADVPERLRRFAAARAGQKMPVGNEAAGTVVAAGASDAAQALLGRTVTMVGGAMYRTHRVIKAIEVIPLPEGTKARDGASLFVNPLTAIGMTNTMRLEGHEALVHTAAASNLGQMLAKLCLADGIPLVNIVRSKAQEDILKAIGTPHIVNSSSDDFFDRLVDALVETGATLAFDAIGGGRQAGVILTAMEVAAGRRGSGFSVYGSTVHKQVYIYGRLDLSPTELTGNFGMAWGVGGWLLTPHLQRVGMEEMLKMRARVVAGMHDIFASSYTNEISLDQMLDVDLAQAYQRKATGEKYLLNPTL